MAYEGNVHVLGENVDTDVMIPGRYLSIVDPAEMAKHIFEEADPGFVGRVSPGDIIMAGANFGSGSGREQAPLGLKALGISCVVAASFSRIFYRMAIDLGLPILVCAEAAHSAKPGERARVDTRTGEISVGGRLYKTQPLPVFVQDILDEGGLPQWVKKEVARRRASAPAAPA